MTGKPSGGVPPPASIRILLVGLEEERGLLVRDALARAGYRMQLAAGPLDASRQLKEKEPDLMVISTLVGGVALETLKAELDGSSSLIPVLLVGNLAGLASWEAWQSPPRRLLLKEPFDMEDVVEAVRKLADLALTEPNPGSLAGGE